MHKEKKMKDEKWIHNKQKNEKPAVHQAEEMAITKTKEQKTQKDIKVYLW